MHHIKSGQVFVQPTLKMVHRPEHRPWFVPNLLLYNWMDISNKEILSVLGSEFLGPKSWEISLHIPSQLLCALSIATHVVQRQRLNDYL